MKPIHFPEANLELQKPEDMTDEQCSPLPVCTCRTADGMPLVISCWEPTPEEWDVLRKQGHIFVAIVSEDSHPPLIVFPNNPFNQEEEPSSPQPTKHPIQPTELIDNILRFKENKIVRYLLDNGGISMNDLARLPFDQDDRQQFAQLIGYSVCGYSDLPYSYESVADYAQSTYNPQAGQPNE